MMCWMPDLDVGDG